MIMNVSPTMRLSVSTLVLTMSIMVGCCLFEPTPDIQPIDNFNDLCNDTIANWFQPRLDIGDVYYLAGNKQEWQHLSEGDLIYYFSLYGTFNRVYQSISESELAEGLLPEEILAKVKSSIYIYLKGRINGQAED